MADVSDELERLLDIARSGDFSSRLDLADGSGLPAAVYEELAGDAREEVVWLIARNPDAPRAVLVELASRSETLHELVVFNPTAPPDLKVAAPLWKHSQLSLEAFLRDVGATQEQWLQLISKFVDHDPRSLGDVWGEVAG